MSETRKEWRKVAAFCAIVWIVIIAATVHRHESIKACFTAAEYSAPALNRCMYEFYPAAGQHENLTIKEGLKQFFGLSDRGARP